MIVSSGFGHDPGASVDGLLGRVAEWQTRTVQVRVSVRTWGFNSPLAHHSTPPSLTQRAGPSGGRLAARQGLISPSPGGYCAFASADARSAATARGSGIVPAGASPGAGG